MMLSSKYGITPYQEQSSAFQQDCEEILNHIPLLLDFQKDTIRRTVFAQRNPKGGQLLSLIDSYTGSGKTIMALLSDVLYTLKVTDKIQKSLEKHETKCDYFTDLHPRCSPYHCKDYYKNLVVVSSNQDLVTQWNDTAESIKFLLRDVIKRKFNKEIVIKVTDTRGKITKSLEKKKEELVILILKNPNHNSENRIAGVRQRNPLFLYNEDKLSDVTFDSNIACPVL